MQVLNLNARYQAQVHALYDALRASQTMLLESAEVVDKSGKQSLIGLDCALKICADEKQVRLLPQNDNGHLLCQKLQAKFTLIAQDKGFAIYFEKSTEVDEIKRLHAPGPLDVLRALRQELASFKQLVFAGMIGFDFIRTFESFPPLPDEPDALPYLCFYLFDLSITVNHIHKSLSIDLFALNDSQYRTLALKALELKTKIDQKDFSLTAPTEATLPAFRPSLDDAAFGQLVEQFKTHILAGDVFQVVPSRSFTLPCTKPYRAYCALKSQNPSPYAFYFTDDDFTLFGASPEFALRYDANTHEACISPIAGTRPRGISADGTLDSALDTRLELELRTDKKEIAEHLMLVDLARNDLARVALPGTRRTHNLLHVDRYQSVMHLVSDVTATLRPDLDALHAYLAAMNMGTLSGAPKIKAHELIYRYSGKRRGFYGGIIGILSADGTFDSCIVIRSALVRNGMAEVQAGCGVVYDSDPQAEALETLNKASSVLLAIGAAENEQ